MSVDKTNRPPDFRSDIDRYGTWGEALFESHYRPQFEKKNYVLFNVTKNQKYQVNDIDFIVAKYLAEDPETPDHQSNLILGDVDNYERIEVKVDTRTIDTGNIPYEMVSHSQLGWCMVTKCDKVFFIIAKENGEELTPIKGLWLDMKKWREFIADKTTKKKCNYIRSENGIFDLLCKVEDLQTYGVVIGEKTF